MEIMASDGILFDNAFLRPLEGQMLTFPLVVVGGATAAVAAALGALQAGAQVCLVQPQAIVGGQLTAQALPAFDDGQLLTPQALIPPDLRDPHQLAQSDAFALSRLQRRFRDRQRQLQPVAGQIVHNPGGGWVTHFAVNPVTSATALNELILPYLEREQLILIPFAEPTQVLIEQRVGERRRVVGVRCQDLQTHHHFTIRGQIVIEATDLGDLLELGGIESRVGQESRAETEEAILPLEARPECQQAFTFCAVVERTAAGQGVPIGAPWGYNQADWLQEADFTSTFWVKNQTGQWQHHDFFDEDGIFRYRRLQRSQADHVIRVGDVTVINWGTSPLGVEEGPSQRGDHPPLGCGNDYRYGCLLGTSRVQRQTQMQRGRDRTQAYVHFLQTHGFDNLKPRGDLTWTADGIALEPYIREARRGIALTTIRHEDVAQTFFPDSVRARSFEDSVGIGQYHYLDMHPNDAPGHVDLQDAHAALPFTIPLGALIPSQTEGLILSAKSIGTTHITNAAYRMHGTEWAIGEAGGHLAAWALQKGLEVRAIAHTPLLRLQFQGQLTRAGIPIFWFNDLSHDDPDFEAIQVLAAAGVLQSEHPGTLNFNPQGPVTQAGAGIALTDVLRLAQLNPVPPDLSQEQITHTQFYLLLQQVLPAEADQFFGELPRDCQRLQRRELARALYRVLHIQLENIQS